MTIAIPPGHDPGPAARRGLGRRRVIALSAALMLTGGAESKRLRRFSWRGIALGADARLDFYAENQSTADAAVSLTLAEVERLEREFSLYRPDSALRRLNATGRLDGPSPDMLAILKQARRLHEISSGRFDVTIQPLWEASARHFARSAPTDVGLQAYDIDQARRHVGMNRVKIAAEAVVLAPGMAVTLNGIAQGFITDRVADVLRAKGWRHVLVGLGEYRATGPRPDGRPWRVAIPEGSAFGELELRDDAVATSAAHGTVFGSSGLHHHLIDPLSGASPNHFRSVTVTAARAGVADAVSTAAFLMPLAALPRLLTDAGAAHAFVVGADGGHDVIQPRAV
ncbi:MAG: FAD:protein FMN transferase [Rhodospirillaceae bacterium]|nr:FAD:protein FMN transferase [Rhodospirillaceae bacterium]